MAANGAVNAKEECSSNTQRNSHLDYPPEEEMDFESFVNISPCKKEDLQSPALAGHGVFQPVRRREQGTVCEDTTSMLIINGVDSLTILEGTSIEIPGMPKVHVESATPEKLAGASTSIQSEVLADSMASSTTVDEMECSTPSEVMCLENTASRDSPISAFTAPTVATESGVGPANKRFPKSFLASAESTPLRVNDQHVFVANQDGRKYLKGIPMAAPIQEIDGSLELSTDTSSIVECRGPQYESIEEADVGAAQGCQELRTSLENVQTSPEQSSGATSIGEIYASQSPNADIPPQRDNKCFQDLSSDSASLEEIEVPQEEGTEGPSVEEGQGMESTCSTDCLDPQEQSPADVGNGDNFQSKGTVMTADETLEAEEPVKEPYQAEHHVGHSTEDHVTPEVVDHKSPSDCGHLVFETQHGGSVENAPGDTPQLKAAALTSIKVNEEDDFVEAQLAPADSLWTTARDGAVRLRMEATGPAAEPPVTVHQMFQRTVERYGAQPALAVKKDGVWETTTYLDYHQQCRAAAKGFLKLGLERFHGVGILGFNSPEWFISDIGAIMAGGFAVGIYTTNSPDACQYVAENCNANILVVENHRQLVKILQIQDQLPNLKAIIQYHDELKEKRPNLYSWKEFIQMGADVPDSQLDAILASQKANQCCTLIYTSGTTGQPKGAMLSHDNLTWVVKRTGQMLGLGEEEVVVSYLPLSHIAAQVVDIWIPMFFGGVTYFADPDALKGSLVTTLREVRPTGFLGVPRVWEKIQEKMKALGAKSSVIQQKVAALAKGIGLQASYNRMNRDSSVPWGYTLANMLVFRRVHAALGLDRCVRCYTGAAPIAKDTLEYFMSLNLPVMELYGMSESTGPHALSVHSAFRIMSAGKEIPGCKTQIYKPEDDGTGELCFWGRHVFMGYLNMEEKTKEALDEEGWLHSGDLGKQDQDGFLFITGRIKELIITAGGENIAPIPIEDAVKEELPIISNAMLIGDKMKFLSMLLTLKCNIDGDTGEPQDDLTTEAIQFCQQLGSSARRVSEVLNSKDPAIYKAIQDGMERVNRRATSNAQKVQKWTILEKDFSVSGGELGPTMKLKRPAVCKMYSEEIENLYKE